MITDGPAALTPDARRAGTGLALSGGGFRATLFGLGSIWRLNDLGWLSRLSMITSVSGGSIVAGLLGLRWSELDFDSRGVARNFVELIAAPIRTFCSRSMDWQAILGGMVPFVEASLLARRHYERQLLRRSDGSVGRLCDLPAAGKGPTFIMYATCMQTGVSVRFTRDGLSDYKLGTLAMGELTVGTAVAASAGFPPLLSPLRLSTDPDRWVKASGLDVQQLRRIRQRLRLADGGVYDNMGLEALWRSMNTVLVSDSGAPFAYSTLPWGNWFSQLGRVRDVLIEQTRALRKRMLLTDLNAGTYAGSYWSIGSRIASYKLADSMCADSPVCAALAHVPTRLKGMAPALQGRLINWGYAMTDTAVRTHVDPTLVKGVWPVPESAL